MNYSELCKLEPIVGRFWNRYLDGKPYAGFVRGICLDIRKNKPCIVLAVSIRFFLSRPLIKEIYWLDVFEELPVYLEIRGEAKLL